MKKKFTVKEKLSLSMENGNLIYSVVPVSSYEKEYDQEESVEIDSFIDSDEKIIFFAYVNKQLAGQIKIIKWWNQFS